MKNWHLITKLDDTDIRKYDIYQRERVFIPTPEKEVEHVEIKGRHGSLTKCFGYKDIPLSIDFYYFEKGESFKKDFRKFKAKFLDAKTLIVNGDEEVYYKIKSMKIENAINDRDDIGEFKIDFTLDPFQYEKENKKINVVSGMNLINNGHESLPIINVTAGGNAQLWINEQTFRLTNLNGTITINCEQKNAYRNTNGLLTNLNGHMIGGFPKLETGKNIIKFTGDISKVEVIANRRWR